ncbi:MAG: TonB family protein [Bryobacterales bacterium]|nr:TonB family protein [Bryobacterales bacterium]
MRKVLISLTVAAGLLIGVQAPPVGAVGPLGPGLNAEQAQDLEKTLERDPDNPGLRMKVMQYYFAKGEREPFLRHLSWLIEHMPTSPATSMGASMLSASSPAGEIFTPADITTVKNLYDRQIAAHPHDIPLVLAATIFFQTFDVRHAESILKSAHQANPGDASLERRLARLYVQCFVQASMKVPPGRFKLRDPEGTRILAEQAAKELVSSTNKVLVGESESALVTVPVNRPEFAGVKDIRDRVSAHARELGIAPPAPGTLIPGARMVDGRLHVPPAAQATLLVKKVEARYPAEAKAAKAEGPVRFELTIGKDGKVIEARLLGGNPLLVQDAEAAVRQWEWKPRLINGQPVEVVTSVEVPFQP